VIVENLSVLSVSMLERTGSDNGHALSLLAF